MKHLQEQTNEKRSVCGEYGETVFYHEEVTCPRCLEIMKKWKMDIPTKV
jgi:hypothetical protein